MQIEAIGRFNGGSRPSAKTLWLVLVLLGSWCASCGTVSVSPQIRSRIEADKRVAMVAPRVEVVRYFADGHGERVEGDETRIAAKLGELLRGELAKRGFKVQRAHLSRTVASTIADTYERIGYLYGMAQMPSRFDRAYLERLSDFCQTYNSVQKQEYASGFDPDSVPIAAQNEVNALVFVRFEKFKRSAGSIGKELAIDFAANMIIMPLTAFTLAVQPATAFTMVVQPAPYSGGALAVTFVDSKTGDVLWGNRVPVMGDFPHGESLNLSAAVSSAFATFPQLNCPEDAE